MEHLHHRDLPWECYVIVEWPTSAVSPFVESTLRLSWDLVAAKAAKGFQVVVSFSSSLAPSKRRCMNLFVTMYPRMLQDAENATANRRVVVPNPKYQQVILRYTKLLLCSSRDFYVLFASKLGSQRSILDLGRERSAHRLFRCHDWCHRSHEKSDDSHDTSRYVTMTKGVGFVILVYAKAYSCFVKLFYLLSRISHVLFYLLKTNVDQPKTTSGGTWKHVLQCAPFPSPTLFATKDVILIAWPLCAAISLIHPRVKSPADFRNEGRLPQHGWWRSAPLVIFQFLPHQGLQHYYNRNTHIINWWARFITPPPQTKNISLAEKNSSSYLSLSKTTVILGIVTHQQ